MALKFGATPFKSAVDQQRKNYQQMYPNMSYIWQGEEKSKDNVKTLGEQDSRPTTTTTGAYTGGQAASSGGSNPYSLAVNMQKDNKSSLSKQMKEREKQYTSRYDEMAKWIQQRAPQAEQERNRATETVNAELQNLLTKADVSKQEIGANYTTQENKLKDEKTTLDKERARIFESRGIADSSYYMEYQTKADTEFQNTLATLGGEKARKLSEIDADITYYQKQSLDKKAEIETAYAEILNQVNQDLTKTKWEKEDAISQLENEFRSKMEAIDDRILSYSFQQEEFRNSVAGWGKETGTSIGADFLSSGRTNNSQLKMQESADSVFDALKKSVGDDGKADPDIYGRLRSDAKISADQFNKKYGYLLSEDEQVALGIKKAPAQKKTNADDEFGIF